MAQQHQQDAPEHMVPVLLEDIAGITTDTIQFGKISLVRVQLIAVIESIKLNEDDAEYVVTNEARTHRMMVQKVYTESFPRRRCEEFLVTDNVSIFGKLRVKEDGTAYINALGLNVIGRDEVAARKISHRMAKKFYEKNHAALPAAPTSGIAVQLGLDKTIGDVFNFPIDLLEPSVAGENNGGQWPSEIEEMAAGLVVEEQMEQEGSSDDDAEDSDGSDDHAMVPIRDEDEDVEDSAGPSTRY
ncbi:hypothetical protein B9Z55_026518 [Caenorhabditis nigoni]|uniref:Uncharacterized protein n=1 Tax=Caenorhabditis nigoni TaxID=1611254 RepID=A0A2G5T3H8_9PELO|nr:hypothetical protein B9Z55_026518 [Caenorhabditis nigoni]